jgi:hypothetical protein
MAAALEASADDRPRLIYFQHRYSERLSPFLLAHKNDHVRCLETFFHVTVISGDCDYAEVLDRYAPDLALFEIGVPFPDCHRPRVRNTRNSNAIPKLALLNADAFCESRSGLVSDVEQLGVEAIFAIATAAPSLLEEFRDQLFIWPNFIDPAVFRDYGEEKTIPVLFTGNAGPLYPWRRRVKRVLELAVPGLNDPHPGYLGGGTARKIRVGEDYARLLNAAWFVPTCGTAAHEVVRKHFEIPACNSCLLTERTAALEAAGFVDMENCVFVDDHDAVGRVAWLLERPPRLRAIIEAGRHLITARHTMAQRSQIHQWFTLRKGRNPGQRIVQLGPFEGLQLTGGDTGLRSHAIRNAGPLQARLEAGVSARLEGDFERAAAEYRKCLGYVGYMPEAILGLAFCELVQGNARAALSWLVRPLSFTLGPHGANAPEPVEWAYFIAALVADGRLADARRFSESFPQLRHPEVDRIRWAVDVIASPMGAHRALREHHECQPSLHFFPSLPLGEWVQRLSRILTANGRLAWAARIENTPLEVLTEGGGVQRPSDAPVRQELVRKELMAWRRREAGRETMTARARLMLHRAETRWGYFLPYKYSAVKHHPLMVALGDALRDRDVDEMLVVSEAKGAFADAALAIARDLSRVALASSSQIEGGSLRTSRVGNKCVVVAVPRGRAGWSCGPVLERELLSSVIVAVVNTNCWKRFDRITEQLGGAGFRAMVLDQVRDGGFAAYVRGAATDAATPITRENRCVP